MSAKTKPLPKLECFVGYEKTDEGYQLYTIYREAVDLLAPKIEFEYDDKDKVMRSVVPVAKLLKSGNKRDGYVVYYDIQKTNKKIPQKVKDAVAADCAELDKIDLKVNALREKYERDMNALKVMESEAKKRIRTQLKSRGVIVKRGRFFHRAMLIDDFRVFLKTDFKFAIKPLMVDELMDLAKEAPSRYRKMLKACVKTTSVTIDPKFYEEKLKAKIKGKDRKIFVQEEIDVDEHQLEEEVIPKLPYALKLMFWWMGDQLDEEGNHHTTLHAKTYNAKNPECQHCGGKFKKSTNEKPKRTAPKLRPVRIVRGKEADTRGKPAKGYSRS